VGGAIVTDFMGSIGCNDLCEFGNQKSPNIVIVAGDSHADQYTNALAALAPDIHFKLIQSGSCFIGHDMRSIPRGSMTLKCLDAEAEMKRWLSDPRVVEVIHSQRWPGYRNALETWKGSQIEFASLENLYTAQLDDIERLYKDFRGRVVIVNSAPNTNLTCLTRPLYLRLTCSVPPLCEQKQFAAQILPRLSSAHFAFVDPMEFICPDGHCLASTPNGNPYYSDEIHLTFEGAKVVVPHILEALKAN
jgi:hypothetical protein